MTASIEPLVNCALLKSAMDVLSLISTLSPSSEGNHEPQDINALSLTSSPSITALGI